MKTLKNYLCAFSILFAVGNFKYADAATDDLTSSMVGCTGCLALGRKIAELEEQLRSGSGLPGLTDSQIQFSVGQVEADLATIKKELETVKTQLAEKTKSLGGFQVDNAELQKENEALKASLKVETEAKTKLAEQVAALEASLAGSANGSGVSVPGQSADAIAARLAAEQEKVLKLEAANQALAAEKEKMLEEKKAMETQAKELLECARQNQEAFARLNASIKELQKENEQLKQDQLGGRSISTELAEALAGSALSTTDKDAEIAEAQARIVELEKANQALATEKATWLAEKAAMEAKGKELLEGAQKNQKIAQEFTATIATLRAENAAAQAATSAAEESSAQAVLAKDAEIADAQATIQRLQDELATVRAQIQTAQPIVPAPVQPTRIVSQVSCWKRYLMPAFAGAAMTYFLMRK